MVLESFLQFIECILSTRSNGGEGWYGREGWDTKRRCERLNLSLEESESTGRFCQSTQTRSEWPLEGGDVGVELYVSFEYFSGKMSLHP